MTRKDFEIYKKELMDRFYWCTTKDELQYLTKEKGHRYLFRCTHFKTKKYFWVFDKTKELMKDADAFHKSKYEEKSKMKECETIAIG